MWEPFNHYFNVLNGCVSICILTNIRPNNYVKWWTVKGTHAQNDALCYTSSN